MQLIDDTYLRDLLARPALPEYTARLWNRRYFIRAQARSKALQTGRGTYLGRAWIVLSPMVRVALYALVFGVVLKISKGMENFVGFLMIGVTYYGFFTKGNMAGSNLLRSSRGLISAFSFPKAALVISRSYQGVIDGLPPIVVGTIGAVLTQLKFSFNWEIIFLPLIFALMVAFTTGITFIVARLSAFAPDVGQVIGWINMCLFFLSGVFYSLDRYATAPVLREIMFLNPIYQFLTAARQCVLLGIIPSLNTWAYLTFWSFGLLIVGYVFFWKAEERYASA